MQFPETSRVIYHKSPLVEVICQFRFPSILSIETELPTKFQESIKDNYPFFNEKVEVQVKIFDDLVNKLPEIVNISPATIKNKNYEFISGDDKWKINLTSNFLSLSTINYSRWEEFYKHLDIAYSAFLVIYKPPFFTRIGLRYRDIIRRSHLGLEASSWDELLEPYMLGLLTAPLIKDATLNINHISEISLENECIVRIASGIIHDLGTREDNFIVDSDFFTTKKIDIGNSIDILNFFNTQGSRLIQWSITQKLHDAMEPELI